MRDISVTISHFLACLLVAIGGRALAVPVLSVRTPNLNNGMYAYGTQVVAEFVAEGGHDKPLVVEVSDYKGEVVSKVQTNFSNSSTNIGRAFVRLPTDKYGFFRVKAKAGEATLSKRGTRPAGQFTYGVSISPESRPQLTQDTAFMGLVGSVAGLDHWMGAHQGFAQFSWYCDKSSNESSVEGRWESWGYSPLLVGSWSSHLPHFSENAQSWIRSNANKLNVWTLCSSEDGRKVVEEYFDKCTKNFRTHCPNPGKRIYQIFWEPDLSAPSKNAIVDAAAYMSDVIKQRDPEALIALPTLSNASLIGWHRELFELGLLKHGDVFDLHPYTDYPPEPNGLLHNIRALKRMLSDYGRPDMPLMCTESGYQTAANLDGERLQLDGMVRAQLILLGEGVWFNCAFYGTDFGGDRNVQHEGDYGLTYNLDYPKPRFGAKHVSPRPVYMGLCAFSMLLDGWKPRESIECLGETVLGYVYTNSLGRSAVAIWDYSGVESTVTLPVGKKTVEIADVMGNRFMRETTDGQLKQMLSTSPIYVFDPDLVAWDKGMKGCRDAAAAATKALEMAPVKVLAVDEAFAGTEPAAAVTVINNNDAARTLTVSTRIVGEPDARQSVEASFAPHETKTVLVPMLGFRPCPFSLFSLEATATDAELHRGELRRKVNFLSANYVPGVGRKVPIGEWTGVKRHQVPLAVVKNDSLGPDAFKSESDLSAEIGFGWNENFLLIDAVVKDDAYRQENSGWRTWDGDAIQFGFAKARLERLTANDYNDSLAQGTTEIDFALTKNGPEGYRTISFDPYRWPTDIHGKGQIDSKECPMSIEKTEVADGVELRYRIALPWRYLNKTGSVSAGERVFVAATFNDLDPEDGFYAAIPMFELKRMAPRHFGAVCLLGESN